jgi:hypothetical protein
MGVGRCRTSVDVREQPHDPHPRPTPQGGGEKSYAASALPGFSGGVIAPESLMSAISLSE